MGYENNDFSLHFHGVVFFECRRGTRMEKMKEFLAQTRLKEQSGDHPKGKEMIANLLADHETIIVCLRQDLAACAEQYQDAGTSDFLTGLNGRARKNGLDASILFGIVLNRDSSNSKGRRFTWSHQKLNFVRRFGCQVFLR